MVSAKQVCPLGSVGSVNIMSEHTGRESYLDSRLETDSGNSSHVIPPLNCGPFSSAVDITVVVDAGSLAEASARGGHSRLAGADWLRQRVVELGISCQESFFLFIFPSPSEPPAAKLPERGRKR